MVSSFQDREYLYMIMEYLRGGDLRYHLCFYEFFNEEQASTSSTIQSLLSAVLSLAWNIFIQKASFIVISNLRTWSFKRMDIWGSLTSEWPGNGKKATLRKPAGLQDTCLLRSFAGWTIHSKPTTLPSGSSSTRWWWARYCLFYLATVHGWNEEGNQRQNPGSSGQDIREGAANGLELRVDGLCQQVAQEE